MLRPTNAALLLSAIRFCFPLEDQGDRPVVGLALAQGSPDLGPGGLGRDAVQHLQGRTQGAEWCKLYSDKINIL